jgi:hypothetical protein
MITSSATGIKLYLEEHPQNACRFISRSFASLKDHDSILTYWDLRITQLPWTMTLQTVKWHATSLRAGVRLSAGAGSFLFFALFGPALEPICLRISPGFRRPEHEASFSLPDSAEAWDAWIFTSTPPIHPHYNATFTFAFISRNRHENAKEASS